MDPAFFAHKALVWVHILLFVFWLGGDVGVFMAGRYFRDRSNFNLDQRLAILKLLVAVDMAPRTAFALMVPVSLSLTRAAGWWETPATLLVAAWVLSAFWLWFLFDAHHHAQTPRGQRSRAIGTWLQHAFGVLFLGMGIASIVIGWPITIAWLGWKAFLFGCIFISAFMIDLWFRPVGPMLTQLVRDGSSDETEIPLRRTMDRCRIWVKVTYALVLAISILGVFKLPI
jgi:hypothetical protein